MTLPFTLRPAIQSDQPAIRALIHQTGINPLGLDWQRFILAVDSQGEMIGCGQVKPHRDSSAGQVLELASIAVGPTWRRRGVAHAVIVHLIKAHPSPLYLTCRAHLGSFYQKFGFARLRDPADMPPYFRRLDRLARLAVKLKLIDEQMWVMRR